MSIPCFVINLKRSTDRRHAMEVRLKALGLPCIIFEATDGKTLTTEELQAYDRPKRRLFFGQELTQGEIGCLLSHRGVYRQMIAQNIPLALILEDDAILSDNLPEVLEQLQNLPVRWDMIRFLSRKKVYKLSRMIGPFMPDYALARPMGLPGGAYGYLLTLEAARRLNRAMEKNWVPGDIVHGQVWRTGIRTYSVIPSPIDYDKNQESTIGNERFGKIPCQFSWPEKIAFPFTRSYLKIYEALGKTAVRMLSWPVDLWNRRKLSMAGKAKDRTYSGV